MYEQASDRPGIRKPSELRSVDDLLEQVRLRPGMWVRRGSLLHLDSMLVGYAIAAGINNSDERFDFWNDGPFSEWLWKRMDTAYPSNLGWAIEIERAAESTGTPPMEMFFSLLDEFRAERDHAQSTPEG